MLTCFRKVCIIDTIGNRRLINGKHTRQILQPAVSFAPPGLPAGAFLVIKTCLDLVGQAMAAIFDPDIHI